MRKKRCPYCKVEMSRNGVEANRPTREHVVPRSRGGKGRHTVDACRRCNHLKADMTVEEFRHFQAAFPDWRQMEPHHAQAWKRLHIPKFM